MGLRQRIAQSIASWSIRSLGDQMTAEQLVASIYGKGSTGPRLGSGALLQAYSTMPWFRAVVQRVSWSVACVPWLLYVATDAPETVRGKSRGKGRVIRRKDIAYSLDPNERLRHYKSLRREDALREITDHPALALLDHGNERMPGQVCRQVTQQHLDMIGEGAWVIERNGLLQPTEILPIPPTWIAMTPWEHQGKSDHWLINFPNGTRPVPKEDVIYWYHPNPVDPYDRGRGVGHALGDELETDEAVGKHLKRWFKNYAVPPMLIWRKGAGPTVAGKSNTERLEEGWLRKLSGRNNVPYFSNQELGVKEINSTFNDMQLSQLRKDERDIIVHVYGTPPEIFGILENSNRSTIDAADYMMARYVQVPRLELLRIVLQKKLIETYDQRLILDYVSPVMEDKEFKLKVIQAAPYAMSIDETRELAGEKPLAKDVGQGHMVPMSSTYVRHLDEAGMSESTGAETEAE